jgi:AAA+ ATPase superfamily predicted ATPase
MENLIIGREKEIARLKTYMATQRSEFVAVYGRRRVGKTYLIKELFENQFTFRMTGRENVGMKEQLQNFSYALADCLGVETQPSNWAEAFRALSKAIEALPEGQKIIFIDELPWCDTPRSNFISALEYFWNSWAYYRSDIKLIVCGSATSWMLNMLINSRGGLHNRVTHKILVSPFSLHETELYFKQNGFDYERPEILDCYMAVGGVAYYLTLFEPGKSVAENINELCFSKNGELVDEFNKLYKSLFKKADNHIAVINALSTVKKGLTRSDLIAKTKFTNNGNLSTLLSELEMCEFIRSYVPFQKEKKDKLYQLIDPFSLFYLQFMKGKTSFSKDYWLRKIGSADYNAWAGYAFETVCLHHIDQIVAGLGISGTINTPCSWIYRPTESTRNSDDADLATGAQIDLLIDRNDKTITVCEMKYCDGEYEIDKQYDTRVQKRLLTFKKVTKTNKTLSVAYVTPHGLSNNQYARKVKQQITADQLFG